jgi:hypothetical protein
MTMAKAASWIAPTYKLGASNVKEAPLWQQEFLSDPLFEGSIRAHNVVVT